MKKPRILALLLAAGLCLSLAACAPKEDPEPTTDGDDTTKTLNLGFIGPLTGGAALYGETAMRGAQIAVDEINADPDAKLKVKLMTEDDEHDGEKAVYAYQKLKDDGAQAIVGCVTTTPCLAVAPDAMADRMFMLTPSATSPQVTEGRDNVYQLCFSDPTMGDEAAQFVLDRALATKVAIISNNSDAYSSGIAAAFKAKAAEIGLEVVSESTFPSDEEKDFTVQLQSAKEAGADLLFLPTYYTPASLIIKQAFDMGYAPKFFGCDGMDGILGMDGFDKTLAEGVILLTPFNADGQDDATKSFVEAYKAKHNGEVPSQFAADGYDCVNAIYKAAIASGEDVSAMSSADFCQLMIDTFSSESFLFTGLTGEDMTWSKTGEVAKNTTVFEIKDGIYVPM